MHAQHAWFCALIAATRHAGAGGGELVAWRSPWHVSRDWKATTDGCGVWRYPDGRELAFVLLLDDPPRVGVTELRERLTSIPDPAIPFTCRTGYGDDTVTLVWCATLRREQVLRHAITKHLGGATGMPVALACAAYTEPAPGGPHDRVWLPLGGIMRREAGRLTLAEITDAARTSAAVPAAAVPEPIDWEEADDDELILYDDNDNDNSRHAA